MENFRKKQPYGGCVRDARMPSWLVEKREDEEYEKRLKVFEDNLRLKYDGYRKFPKSCPHYDFYNRRFNCYHKGKGVNFYCYWNEKMSIECGNEKLDGKVQIWKDVKQLLKQEQQIKPNQSAGKNFQRQVLSEDPTNKRRKLVFDSPQDSSPQQTTINPTKSNAHEDEVTIQPSVVEKVSEEDYAKLLTVLKTIDALAIEESSKPQKSEEGENEKTTNIPSTEVIRPPEKFEEKTQNVPNSESPSVSGNAEELKEVEMKKTDDFDLNQDMKYLFAWFQRLTLKEANCLLELQREQNPNLVPALHNYLSLVSKEFSSASDIVGEEKVDEKSPENSKPKPMFKTLPITKSAGRKWSIS